MSSWYEDMIERVAFFHDWIEGGIPDAYWISSFYFPQGFLTSVLQGYSRKNVIPVDVLSFEFQLEDTDDPEDLDGAPEEGIRKGTNGVSICQNQLIVYTFFPNLSKIITFAATS